MPRSSVGKRLVQVRPKTHGDFNEVARTVLALEAVMISTPNWSTMGDVRRMALKEIFHKVARIGCGDLEHADHWDDIGGYAELGKNSKPIRMPARRRVPVVKRKAKPVKKPARKRLPKTTKDQ